MQNSSTRNWKLKFSCLTYEKIVFNKIAFSLNISSKHAKRKCLKSLGFLLSQYCERKYLRLVHLQPHSAQWENIC